MGGQAEIEEDWGRVGMMPFCIAAFLYSDQTQWQDLKHFFRSRAWTPESLDNYLAARFCEKDGVSGVTKLSADALRDGAEIGIDLRYVSTDYWFENDSTWTCYRMTLPGLAILFAQPACTVQLSNAGVELTHQMEGGEGFTLWLRDHLHSPDGEVPNDVLQLGCGLCKPAAPSLCRSAAVAAVQVLLRGSCRRAAAEKGVAVYQVMRKMLGGRPFPMAVVKDILIFAAQVPKFIHELEIWDLMGIWSTSVFYDPSDSLMVAAEFMEESGHPEGSGIDPEPQPTDEDAAGILPFWEPAWGV